MCLKDIQLMNVPTYSQLLFTTVYLYHYPVFLLLCICFCVRIFLTAYFSLFPILQGLACFNFQAKWDGLFLFTKTFF